MAGGRPACRPARVAAHAARPARRAPARAGHRAARPRQPRARRLGAGAGGALPRALPDDRQRDAAPGRRLRAGLRRIRRRVFPRRADDPHAAARGPAGPHAADAGCADGVSRPPRLHDRGDVAARLARAPIQRAIVGHVRESRSLRRLAGHADRARSGLARRARPRPPPDAVAPRVALRARAARAGGPALRPAARRRRHGRRARLHAEPGRARQPRGGAGGADRHAGRRRPRAF